MCRFVDEHRDEHGVESICKALQIAPSTYYARRSRPESARSVRDRELGEKIESIHAENYGVYGVRKIHKELARQEVPAARCTVERLMRSKGLRGISRAKGPRTTKPAPETGRPSDLVKRRFTAPAPNRLWVLIYLHPHVRRLGLRGVRHRCFLLQGRRLAGLHQSLHRSLGQNPGRRRPRRPDPSLRPRRAISGNPLHRSPGRSRRGGLRRVQGRFL